MPNAVRDGIAPCISIARSRRSLATIPLVAAPAAEGASSSPRQLHADMARAAVRLGRRSVLTFGRGRRCSARPVTPRPGARDSKHAWGRTPQGRRVSGGTGRGSWAYPRRSRMRRGGVRTLCVCSDHVRRSRTTRVNGEATSMPNAAVANAEASSSRSAVARLAAATASLSSAPPSTAAGRAWSAPGSFRSQRGSTAATCWVGGSAQSGGGR